MSRSKKYADLTFHGDDEIRLAWTILRQLVPEIFSKNTYIRTKSFLLQLALFGNEDKGLLEGMWTGGVVLNSKAMRREFLFCKSAVIQMNEISHFDPDWTGDRTFDQLTALGHTDKHVTAYRI